MHTFTIYIVVVRTAFAILSIEIMTFRKLHRQKIKHFYLHRLPSVCLSTRNHPLMMIRSEEIKSASSQAVKVNKIFFSKLKTNIVLQMILSTTYIKYEFKCWLQFHMTTTQMTRTIRVAFCTFRTYSTYVCTQ